MSNPKKEYGRTRGMGKRQSSVDRNMQEYYSQILSGNYAVSEPDKQRSFFDPLSGGYLLYHKERKYNTYEYEAARFLALDGEIVEMTPEKGEAFISATYIKNGKRVTKYGDGKIAGVIYEQKTPSANPNTELANNVKNAIEHAMSKRAKIALIYDANGLFHRDNIRDGMLEFEKYNSKSKYNTVERVCVISKEGKVHWWHWEKD